MRAVLWTGIPFNVSVQDLSVPSIQSPTDVLVRMTAAAICRTDLHVYHCVYRRSRGSWATRSLQVGDHLVIPDMLDPGPLNMALVKSEAKLGLSFGWGKDSRRIYGTQAEYIVVPYAEKSLIPIPANTTEETEISYLFLSDIFATGWTAVIFSGFEAGDTVAIFGAGPRCFARVYVVDSVPARLDRARSIGAIPIPLNGTGGPARQILDLEPNGVTRSVDCVGFEAANSTLERQENTIVVDMVNITSQRGGMGTVGVYAAPGYSEGTPLARNDAGVVEFPVADFFGKGLTWRVGGVDPKVVAPELEELITSRGGNLDFIVSSVIGIEEALDFYGRFDSHEEIRLLFGFLRLG
ncbi:hypothetical protein BDW59DRAFT_175435 [Aspergillus cavernicola]|uniref:Alcohol dehydrogenase N-terminal domain-containing protein n=1 Tax=Aspergillus cavernicola TaxID=176166 RepID=A0ABR4HPQ9_9EURO